MSGAAASSEQGAAIAGLDLDDELQQLLKEQEEFLKQSKRPAAKVTRLGGGASGVSAADSRHKKPNASQEEEKKSEEDADDATPSGPQILGSVVERDVIELNIQNVNVMPRAQATGFPAVQRRGESLFGKRARQPLAGGGAAKPASAAKPSRFSAMKKQQEQANTAAAVVARDAEASSLDPERQEIDRTNRARLQKMSLDEIRQAQQELMMSLDPELVEKLMSKKKNTSSAKKSQAPPVEKRGTGAGIAVGKTIVKEDGCEDEDKEEKTLMQQTPPAPALAPAPTASIDLAKIQSEDELIEQAKLLPPEERAKHEWMQSVSEPAAPTASTKSDGKGKARKAKLQATAERFDFDGECISGIDQKQQPAHSGLFHHGDEPEAAGYTMAELLHLARSTVSSQRAMALTTITKILRKRTQCVNEQSDLSKVFPHVLPNDLPITMRIGLDDQNYTALSAAISALHAFLVPSEVLSSSSQFSFEGNYGTVVAPPRIHLHQNVKEGETLEKPKLSFETPQTEEVVYINTSESPDDGSSISDEELTFLDPVQGFLNMDIGTRLRYILESIQLPDQSATEKMLDILIQIANHSPKAAKDIGTNAKLMKAIQRKFIENEDVLTLQEENEVGLRLTVKALVLVRALCQGSRAVAAFLIGNGVIQSTKGFLAIQGSSGLSSSTLYSEIQLESLRIWRVLLKYGLDFHCFAYLFPILCGFRGADLVRPTGEVQESEKNDQKSFSLRRASVTAALFAALEVLCGLEMVHEAQHYFNQLGFFMTQARDEILTRLKSIGDGGIDESGGDMMVIATALRFLSATASLATKFHLDASMLAEVFQTLQSNATTQKALSIFAISSFLDGGEEALSAVVHFHLRVIANNLLSDDLDEDDATTQFFSLVKPHLHTSIANGLNTAAALQSIHHVALVCDLLTSTGDLIISTKDFYDDAFVATIYAYGLKLMEKFVSGQEHLLSQLLTKLLFQPMILQRVGFFGNEFDATAMSRVLIPIYQALVNTTPELENHSRRNFELIISSPSDKSSCQLRIPQYESEYIGSNLPLPGFWMFCPFSRMEFASNTSGQGDKRKPPSGPTRAESDEMKLIVSATCRYLYQLETATTSSSASSSWKNVVVSYQSEMRDEDKLFHLLHVFFAGADVLFDEHVDTALSQFLKKFAVPVLKSKENGTVLYDGILRNLRRFQHLDPNFSDAGASAAGDNGVSFTSDEQIVMTFVEKLVADFTSLSYGNVHFARCVTLLLTSDFPIAIRKWVWKELQDYHLLHALQPFDNQDELKSHATFARCTTLGKKIHDEQLLQLMKQALVQKQISMDKGAFAYKLAVHHVTVYLFGSSDSHSREQPLTASMSFSRQLLAQDLTKDTSSHVWRHLLTYEPSDVSGSAAFDSEHNTAIKPERVQRIETQAGLSPDQLAAFRTLIGTAAE